MNIQDRPGEYRSNEEQGKSGVKECFEGTPGCFGSVYPGNECAGCAHWDIINPSGENTGWCYKFDTIK